MKDILIVDFNATAPVYTAYFCDALVKAGLRVDILSPQNKEALSVLGSLDLNFLSKIESARSSSLKASMYIYYWHRVLKIAKNYKAIHFQWFPLLSKSPFDYFMLQRLERQNSNLFYTVHNCLPHEDRSQKTFSRYKKIYELIPNLVVHTSTTKEELISKFGLQGERITKINHGPFYKELAFEPDHLTDPKKITLGMIGHIRPYKGYEDAFTLVEQAKGTDNEFNLSISGGGKKEYIDKLKSCIKKLDLEENVTINHGYIKTKALIKLHHEVDAILAPYKRIDQSGAVITALSLGIPVLGYSVGGISQVISNEYNGYLSKKNEPEELLNGIKWLQNNSKKDIYENCIKSTDSISWEVSAQTLKPKYLS